MSNLDALEVEKLNYLMQFGYSIDFREWQNLRRDQQYDYLRRLGWSFDAAYDFSHADNTFGLEIAVLFRSAEVSKKCYNSGANRVVSNINREYQKAATELQKKEAEENFSKWLDGYIGQVFAEAKVGNSPNNWKSGQGFQKQKYK